jgi:AcrR family transcriptional regulator
MTAPDASTRDRLLDAAVALFVRQGYGCTTIADIQRACGLSPGSGALYKHFPSQKALLQEAVRRQVEQMGAMRDDYDRTRPTNVPGALRRGADQIWANIENNAELVRVMFREPEALDDMIGDVWSAAATTAYQRIGRALSGAKNAGAAVVEDRSDGHRAVGGAGLPADRAVVGRPHARQYRHRSIPRSAAQVGRRCVHRQSADLTARCRVGCRTAGKHSVGWNGWRTGFGHGEVITTRGRNHRGPGNP